MSFGIDLWKIVLESNCSEETESNIRIGLDDLNAKAKAFDEIREFIDRKLEEKSPIKFTDFDYGLYQAYNIVDDIIKEYMEDE